MQEEQQGLSKKLRLQADLSQKADQAAQAKVCPGGPPPVCTVPWGGAEAGAAVP